MVILKDYIYFFRRAIMCKYNYKKDDDEEKGKVKVIFQKIKEKIKYMDRNDLILVLIPVLLLVILFGSWTNKKAVDIQLPKTIVQNQVVTQQNINKSEEIYLNETAKLNLQNFDVFISKKAPNTGLFLIRPSDIVSKKDKIVLSDSVNTIELSGSEEILKNLKWSLSDNFKKINITPNSITIELNRKENTVFSFNLKNLELLGEYLNSNSPLLSVTYTESYAE